MGHAIQIAQRIHARILQHEMEAAKAAHAVDGRRLNNHHQAAVGGKHQHLQLGREVGHNVGRRVALAAPLIGGLGGDKHHARVGGAAGTS